MQVFAARFVTVPALSSQRGFRISFSAVESYRGRFTYLKEDARPWAVLSVTGWRHDRVYFYENATSEIFRLKVRRSPPTARTCSRVGMAMFDT